MRREYIIQTANELIAILRPNIEIRRIYAYGSQVRGDAEYGSDLDLLVEVPEMTQTTKRKVQDAAWRLSLEKELLISVLVVSENEFRQGPLSVSGLARSIGREGIEIAA